MLGQLALKQEKGGLSEREIREGGMGQWSKGGSQHLQEKVLNNLVIQEMYIQATLRLYYTHQND